MLNRTQVELNSTIESLRLAERNLERERSTTIRKLEQRYDQATEPQTQGIEKGASASAVPSPAPPSMNSLHVMDLKKEQSEGESKEQLQLQANETDVQEGTSGLSRSEIEELQAAAQMGLKEAEELRADKIQLMSELDGLKLKVGFEFTSGNINIQWRRGLKNILLAAI